MSNKLYNVGMYIRLSRENTAYNGEDSLSIENQQAMLSKFIDMMPGWIEKRIYIDNGATGGNFNRQGFRDMMEDVRQRIINLVLVQDLSRFGRNYLEAGKYLEEELPSLGCRFVALSDGIDTETGENDILPFLNAMNDYYLKNLSDRIKSVLIAKAKDGQKLAGTVPYGYDRSPEEHTRLIIDDYAAKVVRRIFDMRAAGIGYASIAGVLNKENILPPRLYYFQSKNRETKANTTRLWKDTTVKRILHNELYLGHTVSFKTKTRSYRDGRLVNRDKSEWICAENTHTPIVDDVLWETVQQINRVAKSKADNYGVPRLNLFAKIAVCADCKTNLVNSVTTKTYKSGKMIRHISYRCRTHLNSGGCACSGHRISELNLKKLVFAHVKEKAGRITLNEDNILQELERKLIGTHKAGQISASKERRDLEQQIHKFEVQMEQLYEDKVSGIISADTFTALVSKTEAQRLEIVDRHSQLTQSAEDTKAKLKDIDRWIGLIKEKSIVIKEVREVDRDFLESLIDKIEVGDKKVVNGVNTQDVRIFYKYVGAC